MLDPAHPDAECKPGEKRMIGAREYTFGQNQFSSFWRGKAKDGIVTCSKDFPHGADVPYIAGGRMFRELVKAADFARATAKAEYERAKAIVDRYEAG